MSKKDDSLSHQNSINVPHFIASKRIGLFRHWTLRKSFKRFITEYIPDARTVI